MSHSWLVPQTQNNRCIFGFRWWQRVGKKGQMVNWTNLKLWTFLTSCIFQFCGFCILLCFGFFPPVSLIQSSCSTPRSKPRVGTVTVNWLAPLQPHNLGVFAQPWAVRSSSTSVRCYHAFPNYDFRPTNAIIIIIFSTTSPKCTVRHCAHIVCTKMHTNAGCKHSADNLTYHLQFWLTSLLEQS